MDEAPVSRLRYLDRQYRHSGPLGTESAYRHLLDMTARDLHTRWALGKNFGARRATAAQLPWSVPICWQSVMRPRGRIVS
jgi:hypothetical protein